MQSETIPCDDELRLMTPRRLDAFALTLSSPIQRERLSDALLRINHGWISGAHSEASDTSRNRKKKREVFLSHTELGEPIFVGICGEAVDRLKARAFEARLSKRQRDAWILQESGLSQAKIASKLGISQTAVSRLLTHAGVCLRAYIDTTGDPYHVFCQEQHRTTYQQPPPRPALPTWLEEARRILEEQHGLTTCIQAAAPGKIELWSDKGFEVSVLDKSRPDDPGRAQLVRCPGEKLSYAGLRARVQSLLPTDPGDCVDEFPSQSAIE